MNAHSNIKKVVELPENRPGIRGLQALREQLRTSNQRGLILCRTEAETDLDGLLDPLQDSGALLLTNRTQLAKSTVAFSKAETLLGLEADTVVLDLFSGFNIDVFCMAIGLLKAGGLMLMLCPPENLNIEDRYGLWQGQVNSQQFFLPYFFESVGTSPVVIALTVNQKIPEIKALPGSTMTPLLQGRTAEQAKILQQLSSWVDSKERKLFFLTADRGRGKSTTLGLFANAQAKQRRIIVTAASRAQASVLLNSIDKQDSVEFMAPDELIRRQPDIDCLIIDEAAMIPFNLLQQCLARAAKTVLATTTGGYEGTGQGFLLKFMAGFSSKDYVHESLHDPIRWGQNDLLEQVVNQTLLFDIPEPVPQGLTGKVNFDVLDKQQLNKDFATLKSIYFLLVSAHYRTRPSDLRQLMDDDNQRVVVARMDQSIVGVLLLNREGGFSEALSQQVFMGERRPQGHLLAQMITAQAGIRSFACWEGYRVQRITVHEGYRRQGIGQRLIKAAEKLVEQEGVDYLGSSFALDSAVAPFWSAMGFRPIHISAGKGKSSGRQTVAVIKTSNPEVDVLSQSLSDKIHRDLPLWLMGYCRDMMWQDVRALLQMLAISYPLNKLDQDAVKAFSQGHRGFDLTQSVLQRLLIAMVYDEGLFNDDEQQLLIEKVLLNRSWQECRGFNADVGRKALTSQIRRLVLIANEQK